MSDTKTIHSFEEVPRFSNEKEEADFWATHHLSEELLDRMERRGNVLERRRYSGKVSLRMPKSLHRDLALLAAAEGVSLNQLMVVTLAQRAQEAKTGK
jgi:predicted HicB family RNase H-like nuclease